MSDPEWQRLQEAMRTAKTPQEKQAASEAMRRYLQSRGQRSKLALATHQHGGKANTIPLEALPQAMLENPEVYDRVRKIVTGDKKNNDGNTTIK